MLRSKSRSGFLDFGRKSQKSALSRTISASKLCRGDPLMSQIDANALKPLDRNYSSGATSSEVVSQLTEELKLTKSLLEMAEQERERALDDLRDMKMEMEVSKQIDTRLAEKDKLIDGLEVELSIFKASRSVIMESLSESKKKIKELENLIENLRVCENKTCDSKGSQTKIELEKLDNYVMSSLKRELKLALGAKEESKRAMDDLAVALNQAKTEANSAKEKLGSKEMDLEKVKQEAEQNAKLLVDVKRENERHKNTVERLRLEADESLLAWNEREMGFVKCVKEAEDERTRTQQENIRLADSLKSANATIDTFREENLELKATLKQAMGIAKIENNSQPEKDEGLDFLARENRKLSVKELNRPLIVATIKDPKIEGKKQGGKARSVKSTFEESKKCKIQKNRLSFDLSELKRTNGHEDARSKVGPEDRVEADKLTGSIFDNDDAPKLLSRRVSFSFMNGNGAANSEDINRPEVSDFDDPGNSWGRRRRTFLQSFEDLIKGRSVEKEENSVA